jgi:cysteinyl-tRNA synthetase
MSEPPPEIRRLAQERDRARRAKDFAAADALRDRLREAGYDVEDSPAGSTLIRRNLEDRPTVRRPEDVPSVLGELPAADVSVQWLVEGWAHDVTRGIRSFRLHHGHRSTQHVVIDASGGPTSTWDPEVEVVTLDPGAGWASGRNAGLRRSGGRVVVLADGSVEATADAVGPLVAALEDLSVGLTGPFGLVTRDLRQFEPSSGPDVDALEGHLIAFRRELLSRGVAFDPAFTFYRNADLDFSFQVKALGLRVTVTPVPVVRHEHRVWEATPPEERERLSRRNFGRFLRHWRDRWDLLVEGQGSAPSGNPGGR